MRYAFIVNPFSRRGRTGRKVAARLREQVDKAGLEGDFLMTKCAGHARELALNAASQYDVVVAVGGDGTIHEVANGLIEAEQKKPLGIIPCGTGNDFIKMTRHSLNLESAVCSLRDSKPVNVDYGRIRWLKDAQWHERAFVNAVGVGFDAKAAAIAPRYKFLPGTPGYVVSVIHTLFVWRSPRAQVFTVTSKNACKLFDGPVFLASAGNGTTSGGGFQLTPNATLDSGFLELCIVQKLSFLRALRLVPDVLRAQHMTAPEVRISRQKHVRIESDQPLSLHAEGEMLTYAARCFEIEVVPGGLTLLAPPAFFEKPT